MALGSDGATPFLNPAGIGRIQSGTVSFSSTFLGAKWNSFSPLFQPRNTSEASLVGDTQLEGTSYSRILVNSVPSTLCVFLRLKKLKERLLDTSNLAFCMGSSERSETRGNVVPYRAEAGPYRVHAAQSFDRLFRRTMIGPTFGFKAGDKWSFGGSLHAVHSLNRNLATSDSVVDQAGATATASSFRSEISAYSVDASLRLGASYHPDRWVTYGLSLQLPSVHLFDLARAVESVSTSSGETRMTVGVGSYRAPPPASVAAGVGYEWGKWRIETNLFFFFPQSSGYETELEMVRETVDRQGRLTSSTENIRTRNPAHGVVDAAIGIEHYLRPGLSMLSGFSTDFAASAPLRQNPVFGSSMWARSSRVTASWGLGSYGAAGELLVGLEASYAQGKTYAVDSFGSPNALALIDQRTFGMMLVIAGQTNLATMRGTVDQLRKLTAGR